MASSSTRPRSSPTTRAAAGAAAPAAGAGSGPASRMASSPCSILEDDLKSRSFSFWKNAMPASPLPAPT